MKKTRSTKPEAPASARLRAVRQLNRIELDRAFIGLAGSDAADDPRTERQTTEYVAGVTRWRRWLDFLLQEFYRGRLDKMEPTLRQILRVALYDLLFLDTPPHAALHEAVELAKREVRPKAGGLVNGLLRTLLRQKDRLPAPADAEEAEALAIRYSHPTWLVRRWLARFGREETEALLRYDNARPVFGLRVNTAEISVEEFQARLDDLGVDWEPSAYLDDFVRVQRLQPIRQAGLLEAGVCAVQDESTGLVVRLLDPQPGETVIDACAAPGGKALYAAARMAGTGQLLAFDLHEGRLGLLREAARARGLTMLHAEAADLRDLARRPEAPRADRVLVDAPCSGLGVLAKRADLRWNRTPEEIDTLAGLQDELLGAAATLVRPGGVLVYATCTIAPEENQARVVAFLARHPGFQLELASAFLPAPVVSPEGFLTTLPQRHGIDGAFAARLRRTEA